MATAIMVLFGVLVGFFAPILFAEAAFYFMKKSAMKSYIPSKMDDNLMCKGAHIWINAKTLTEEGVVGKKVCRICGFISGTNFMASQEAIDRMEENSRAQEVEDRIYKVFLDKEDDELKEYFREEIKAGVDFNKILNVHSAGITFSQRYSAYKSTKSEEIERESTRGKA